MVFYEILLKLCKIFHVNVSIEGNLASLTDEECRLLARAKAERRLWFAAGILCVFFCLVGCWTALHTLDIVPTNSLIAVIGSLYFGNEVGKCIHFYFRNKEVEDAIWNEAMNGE